MSITFYTAANLGATGLTGTAGFTVYPQGGGPAFEARTPSGVVEHGASGIYSASFQGTQGSSYVAVWDRGVGAGPFATDAAEASQATGAGTVTVATSAALGASGLAGTAGFAVYPMASATAVHPRTTSGVAEIGGEGGYAASFSGTQGGSYLVVWDTGGGSPTYAGDSPQAAPPPAQAQAVATRYSVVGIPSAPVAGAVYPVAVILDGPASASGTVTFAPASGITWGGPVSIAAGAVSGATTVLFASEGSYSASSTHTGLGFSGDPSASGFTVSPSSGVQTGVLASSVTLEDLSRGGLDAHVASLMAANPSLPQRAAEYVLAASRAHAGDPYGDLEALVVEFAAGSPVDIGEATARAEAIALALAAFWQVAHEFSSIVQSNPGTVEQTVHGPIRVFN